MTESGENGEKQDSRDPKNIASFLLVLIAVIMLALLVRNCVTDTSEDSPADSENKELSGSAGYADQNEYLIYTTGSNSGN